MSARPICEICAKSSPVGATSCSHCGCSFGADSVAFSARADDTPKIADFGFRRANTDMEAFREAEAVFLSSFSPETSAAELGYRRESVLENDNAYYIPVGWIGCSGHLVTKRPLRLIAFGSYIGSSAHIWAHYRGISMAPLGRDRRNTLRILSISDLESTVRVLKTFLDPKRVDDELSLGLSSLPLELEGIDLYFGIQGLLQAEANDWFRFEVR